MNSPRGFVSLGLVLIIVVGVVALGGAGWWYFSHQDSTIQTGTIIPPGGKIFTGSSGGKYVTTPGGGRKSLTSSVWIEVLNIEEREGELPIVHYRIDGTLPSSQDAGIHTSLHLTMENGGNRGVVEAKIGTGTLDFSTLVMPPGDRTITLGTYFLQLVSSRPDLGLAGSEWLADSAKFIISSR